MYRIALEWVEADHLQSKIFAALDPDQIKEIQIGRDPHCDITLADPSVSRLHARIFYDADAQQVLLQNSTGDRPLPNFVSVDRQRILQQAVLLQAESLIQLGKVLLRVRSLEIFSSRPPRPATALTPEPFAQSYGLQCINGHQVSYDHVGLFCPFCGTALQSVQTVILSTTAPSAPH